MTIQGMTLLSQDFEGCPISVINYKGQPVWPARQVGKALGYSDDGGRFSEKIAGAWSDEFSEGSDFFRVAGEDLTALKFDATDSVVSKVNRELLLLTETGVWISSLLSKKPAGRRLRRWLATEVLPRLARGELVEAPVSQARVEVLERRVEKLEAREHLARTPKRISAAEQSAQWQESIRLALASIVEGLSEIVGAAQLQVPVATALGVPVARVNPRRIGSGLFDLGWRQHRHGVRGRVWVSPLPAQPTQLSLVH